ncbi:MAG: thiamine-phosphate diphosphorylase [Deltaproteobacteria bacterium RIFOXYA2_FULL_55_11]|nr:MAG: thiamine-phosphate diphosphorylase [Deltaproteobacteria bacterium RIFOXYA2_FULL_55_11]
MRSPNFDLYLVTDRNQTGGRDLLWVLERALEGGVRAVQLREKDLGGRELFVLAEKTKRLCERYQANLFVNDRVDVALGVDADGVHLGGDSMPVRAARELLGAEKLIGVSTHSINEASEAEREKADFILFGPVYFTASKAAYGEPQGLGRLKKVVEKISLPVYAIGGVKVGNIAEVKETGVRGIALISAVLSASDPRAATRRILETLAR